MPASPWNDASDRQLLLVIIQLTAPQLPKWDQVAVMMGEGFTAESVRQHFQKIRKEMTAKLGETGAADGATTPVNGTTQKTPTKANGKRKVRGVKINDQDDEEGGSPRKKRAFKAESEDAEDEELA